MSNLKMFCLSMSPNHYDYINNLGYIPVGLGEKKFNEKWFTDKSGDNISERIDITANTLSITGYGKIILIKLKMDG